MSTQPAPRPTDGKVTDPGDLVHYVFDESPDVALCGTDRTGLPFRDGESATCVVCIDLKAAYDRGEWEPA